MVLSSSTKCKAFVEDLQLQTYLLIFILKAVTNLTILHITYKLYAYVCIFKRMNWLDSYVHWVEVEDLCWHTLDYIIMLWL